MSTTDTVHSVFKMVPKGPRPQHYFLLFYCAIKYIHNLLLYEYMFLKHYKTIFFLLLIFQKNLIQNKPQQTYKQ